MVLIDVIGKGKTDCPTDYVWILNDWGYLNVCVERVVVLILILKMGKAGDFAHYQIIVLNPNLRKVSLQNIE